MQPTAPGSGSDTYITANDRMKRRSAQWFSRSLVLAVLLHFALFSLTPTMQASGMATPDDTEIFIIPPDLDIPDPPDRIRRPAEPVMSDIDVPDDVTIPDMTHDAWTPERLAAPQSVEDGALQDFSIFTRSMVAPYLLNPAEVERALVREYPGVLRDAGIGGAVDVNLWLDETGRVVKAEVARSSGYELLDAAALQVVDEMRLAPAQNRGTPIRVIVTLPVRFTVRR